MKNDNDLNDRDLNDRKSLMTLNDTDLDDTTPSENTGKRQKTREKGQKN